MNDASDIEQRLSRLMKLAQAGDRKAYAELIETVIPLLRHAIRGQLRYLPQQDSEDLLQDTLISVHTARASYDPSRPFLPWLMTIARHRVTDGARRYWRRRANETDVDRPPETFSDPSTHMEQDSYGDDEALIQAIERLPPGQRQAIKLLKLQELSLKEAAAKTGLSISALKVAVHRGVKALGVILRKES